MEVQRVVKDEVYLLLKADEKLPESIIIRRIEPSDRMPTITEYYYVRADR